MQFKYKIHESPKFQKKTTYINNKNKKVSSVWQVPNKQSEFLQVGQRKSTGRRPETIVFPNTLGGLRIFTYWNLK